MISLEQPSPTAFAAPAPGPHNGNGHKPGENPLVENLRQSAIFRDYQRAFETTTGLPLTLQAPGALGLAHRGSRHQSPFCVLMLGHNKSCSACLEVQQRLRERPARAGTETLLCHAGLAESCAPVRLGPRTLAFLHAGQVLLHPPTSARFNRTLRRLAERGITLDPIQAQAAYFHTRVIDERQYEAMLRLLAIFARHLAVLSNQLTIATHPVDPPVIARAKIFIADHHDEPISLGLVARAVNTSSFYFCKMFRRTTGLKFVDYVGRVRVEHVKQLLLNPHSNISEAAYAAGFTSLSQFNRIFKRVVGAEPRTWREQRAV
jgi:AraC-like DNA-binding protein